MMPSKKSLYPWLLWIALILQGLVFISTTAIWEGFDEPFHYAYVQYLAETGALPVYGKSLLSRELTRSFELAPLSIPFNTILASRYTTFASYWQLSDEERAERARALRQINKEDRAAADTKAFIANYEVHQAPLYYLISVPVYRMCSALDLPTRVFCLRLFSLLIGSSTLLAAYAAARRALPGLRGPHTVAFVIALMPMVAGTIARISNDALAVPLGGLAAFLIIDYFARVPKLGRAIQIGIVLGLGLLSKAYFLAILAAAVAVFVLAAFKSVDKKRLLSHLALLLGLAVAIGGWWYARNHMQYGNFSGLQEVTLTANMSISDRIAMAGKVPWLMSWRSMFKQHIWLGNMSLMELSRGTYNIAYFLVLIAIVGLGIRGVLAVQCAWKRKDSASCAAAGPAPACTQDQSLIISFLLYSFFLVAAAYHMWQNFILVQMPGGTGGYYLYAVIVPELLLLMYGFQALPWKAGRIAQGAAILYVVSVNFVAYFCKMIPSYGGISIPRFHLSHLFEIYSPATLQLMLNRISLQQASWLGPAAILVIMVCHFAWMIFVTWQFFSPGMSAGDTSVQA
jgi:hypothetical protein